MVTKHILRASRSGLVRREQLNSDTDTSPLSPRIIFSHYNICWPKFVVPFLLNKVNKLQASF